MALYLDYYNQQVGGGGVKHYFTGSRSQRGRGVGGWLGGLFRHIIPYVKSGAKAIGKEALKAGMHVLQDVAGGKSTFSEAMRRRAHESRSTLQKKAAEKLGEMMSGSGYKPPRSRRKRQSVKKHAPTRTGKNKKLKRLTAKKTKKKKSCNKRKNKRPKRTVSDIFA